MNRRRVLSCLLVLFVGAVAPTGASGQTGEYVYVRKVQDDNLIIARSNGALYSIQKGVGCLSAWRYEGKRVVVVSPGLFLGVGSRLVLPDSDQECRIWDHELLSTGQDTGFPRNPTQQGTMGERPLATRPNLNSGGGCFETTIMSPSPFMGNNGEVFRVADESLWEVKYEYEYLYEYLPDVVVCPASGKLVIGGKTLNIAPVAAGPVPSPPSGSGGAAATLIQSKIDGEFTGWEGETIFKLMNGQIWQQASYAYTYHYAYMPDVTIYQSGSGYKMKVDGVDGAIVVRRLR